MKRLALAITLTLIAAASFGAQHPADPSTGRPLPNVTAAPVVNINTATLEQLQFLPRVGKVLAGRIIDYRTLHGQFRVVSDLRQVKGFGEKSVARVAPFVAVSGVTTATAKIKAGAK